MLPFLRLGPFLVQTPMLALLIGFWIGSSLAEKRSVQLKLSGSDVSSMMFYGLIAGLLGARLAYAVQYLNLYLANPLSLFALTPNTMSLDAGVMIGPGVATFYAWWKRLPPRPTLDALTPGLAVFMVAVGVSNIFSGAAFGSPVRLPWAIHLWDAYRHPTQIYETITALAILVFVLQPKSRQLGDGAMFLLFIALTAAARILVEGFRGDSVVWAGGFREAQVISLVVLTVSLRLFGMWAEVSGTRKLE